MKISCNGSRHASFLRRSLLILALATALSACFQSDDGPACGADADDHRDTAWRKDIQCAVSLIEKHHPSPFRHTSRATFEEAAKHLEQAVPQLAPEQIAAELMRLVARVNDVHTGISIPNYILPFAPVTFRRFDDGLYLVRAPEHHGSAIGKRVAAINGLDVADVARALHPLLPAETPTMRPSRMPRLLDRPGLLWARGIAGDVDRSQVALAGHNATVAIDTAEFGLDTASAPDPDGTGVAISFTGRERNYWAQTIPSLDLLYVQYNLCFQDSTYRVDALAEDVRKALEAGEASRVVVDLRENPGGFPSVIYSLRDVLAEHAPNGGLYVAIGPNTYSSALQNAVELRDDLGAILIGNATAEPVNHYGNIEYFNLPYSGIELRISSARVTSDPGAEGALQPDIELPLRGADYVNGVDPVLEWFKTH